MCHVCFCRFDIPDDKETFFTNAERSLVAKFMLDRTMYLDDNKSDSSVHIGQC